MGSGSEASRREPVGREQWEQELAETRVIRRMVKRYGREDEDRRRLDQQADEIVGDLHDGDNPLDRVTFARVVRWILLDRDAEAETALRSGVLEMGPVRIVRLQA